MTLMSGAYDKKFLIGILFYRKYLKKMINIGICIGGKMICSFLTNVNIYKYITNMRNNLTPYSKAVGHRNVHFLTPYFKFIKREKINDNELFKSNGKSVDPFDYHFSNCGKNSFKKLRILKFLQIIIRTVILILA